MNRKEKVDQANKNSNGEKSKSPPKVVKKPPSVSPLRIAMEQHFYAVSLLTTCAVVLLYFIYRSYSSGPPSEARILNASLLGYSKVSVEKYGHHVSIDYNRAHTCSGNIISAHYVLTAAGCVTTYALDDLTVVSGTERINTGGVVHRVVDVIAHEDREADIALVRVSPPFEEDGRRQFVALVDPAEPRKPTGHPAFITGWGRGDHLEFGIEPLADGEVCKRAYGEGDGMGLKVFCAGVLSEGNPHGACPREMGSGLLVQGFLAGIFSYGTDCNRRHRYPGIYVDVAYYRQWINKHSGV